MNPDVFEVVLEFERLGFTGRKLNFSTRHLRWSTASEGGDDAVEPDVADSRSSDDEERLI